MTPEEEQALRTAQRFLDHLSESEKNWDNVKRMMIKIIAESKETQDVEIVKQHLFACLKVLTSLAENLVEYEKMLKDQAETVIRHIKENKNENS